MSILLDIGQDLIQTRGLNGLLYKDTKLNTNNKYFLIGENSIKTIDPRCTDDVVYFIDRLKLCYNTDANKALLQTAPFSKKNMSISPLALLFKIGTVKASYTKRNIDLDWHDFVLGIGTATFDAALIEINQHAKEHYANIKLLKQQCLMYLQQNIDALAQELSEANDSTYIRIIYNVDLEYYKFFNIFFYDTLNKIFAKVTNVKNVNGILYGNSPYINLSSNKPFLVSNIYSNKNDVYAISVAKNTNNIGDLPYVTKRIKTKKGVITYWEYDTKEPTTTILKNIYIGKNKKYAVCTTGLWQLKKYLQDKKMLNTEIINLELYHEVEGIILKQIIKELRAKSQKQEIINDLNTLLSIKSYYNFEGGKDCMDVIKKTQQKDIHIQNDQHFSYLLGQVVYYVNSFSAEAQKRGTMGYLYKYINNNSIKEYLVQDLNRYQHYLNKNYKLFSDAIVQIMQYQYKKLDKCLFIAGALDTNIFYTKQQNEMEEVE